MNYSTRQHVASLIMEHGSTSYIVDSQKLLAMFLGTKKASIIVDTVGYNINDIVDAAEEGDLSKIKGLSTLDEATILASVEFSRRRSAYQAGKVTVINSVEKAQELFQHLVFEKQEVLVCAALNTKNHVVAVKEITRGTVNASMAHPRDILRFVLRHNAAAFIIAHCHPSGESTPSQQDIAFTKRLAETGKMTGITLLDHIIIAKNGNLSFAESYQHILNTYMEPEESYSV